VPIFRPTNELDRVFRITILLKALDGALEVLGGLLLFVLKPESVTRWATSVTQHELSTDPNDFLARHILHSAHDFAAGGRTLAAVYLLSHGITKIILVVEILREHLWAYKGMVVMLGLFIIYQVYRMAYKPSIGLVLLTLFDAFIIVLTLREEKRQRRVLANASVLAAPAP
jgi:uncharacterized membrane protein